LQILGSTFVALAALSGCRTTDVVDQAALDPNAPLVPYDEFHKAAKALFKRCIQEFAEDQWELVAADGKRLETVAKRWRESSPPSDAKKTPVHRELTAGLETASGQLVHAADKRDAPQTTSALGAIADRLHKLRELEPIKAASENGKPPAK
jgi:hypothetical protein